MILGASYSQLPLYAAAKRLGVRTVAVSTPGDWPGFEAAEEFSHRDISDPVAVLEAAKNFHIDGIATCCLDAGVSAIGYVCEHMGLKGLSASAGRISGDKFLMKEAFQKGGVSCARHICVHSEEELGAALDRFVFPVILKAVDLMGSRGLFRCCTKEEARAFYPQVMAATRREYCLVEEFIEGKILGCEAMIRNGKLLFCLPNNIEAYESNVPTPIGHSVPYKKQDILGEEVERQVRLAVQAVGLDNCPVNCDLIEKDDRIYVLEITGRAGGTCLPEMVSLYYDMDYYEAIVRLALDLDVEEMFAKEPPCTPNLSRTLTSPRDGVLKAVRNDNEPAEDIVDLSFNVEPGEEIHRYQNGRDRLGQVILRGSTLAKCEARLTEVLSKIGIEFIE